MPQPVSFSVPVPVSVPVSVSVSVTVPVPVSESVSVSESKMPKYFHYLKRTTKQTQTTIVPSLSFPPLLRYLKEFFIFNCMIISHIMIFCRNISPVFALCIRLLPLCLKQLMSGWYLDIDKGNINAVAFLDLTKLLT